MGSFNNSSTLAEMRCRGHAKIINHQSVQFWSGFIPVNGSVRIYPTLTAISSTPTLHLVRFKASSFSKPTLLLSSSFSALHFKLECFSQNMPVPSHPLFPSIPTSPFGTLSSFSPSVLHHTLLSRSFSKLPFHFPSNTCLTPI